jgi:GNAT superfamily N-acetyltransferase
MEYPIRTFTEADRPAVEAMGFPIIDWWNQHAALHLVAGEPAVAQMQIVDRGTTPTRRPGRTEMRLFVAPGHRRQRIGHRLYEQALAFARARGAESMRAAYMEHTAEEPASFFLKERGFVELQRYCPQRLDLARWDPAPFQDLEPRCIAQGVRFFRYSDVPDTDENRRRLFDLENEARADMPFRETEPVEHEPYEEWAADFAKQDHSTLELAEIDGRWVGMCLSITWGFTGVARAYRGRGIATALKVRALCAARERGVEVMETENQFENHDMLAINRKLGYEFGPQEVECIQWLR